MMEVIKILNTKSENPKQIQMTKIEEEISIDSYYKSIEVEIKGDKF